MYDESDLKVEDILRKDFKKWTKIGRKFYLIRVLYCISNKCYC